jgi:hypothetical protein
MRAQALWLACTAVLAAACGAASTTATRPTTCLRAPGDTAIRRRAIDDFGRRAWDAMRAGEPQRLLFDELDLRALLDTAGSTRITAHRLSLTARLGSTADFPTLLASAEYAGVCLQGAREESGGGVVGLAHDGWTIDRVLVIGIRPGGRRIAAWIEGTFVYTDAGIGALDLERVEQPRWEHSDLELAPCDFAIRNDLPEHAR